MIRFRVTPKAFIYLIVVFGLLFCFHRSYISVQTDGQLMKEYLNDGNLQSHPTIREVRHLFIYNFTLININ